MRGVEVYDYRRMVDPDAQILAGLAESLAADYLDHEEDLWKGSPFEWIRCRASRQKGAIGEALVSGWAATKGLNVVRSPNSDADRVIHGHRIEIKYSNLWKSGAYKFQQIRNQDYDFVLCVGLSPWDAHGWLIPKKDLMQPIDPESRPGLANQHAGVEGSDTRWLSILAENPPSWLAKYGGRMAQVYDLIVGHGHGPY